MSAMSQSTNRSYQHEATALRRNVITEVGQPSRGAELPKPVQNQYIFMAGPPFVSQL